MGKRGCDDGEGLAKGRLCTSLLTQTLRRAQAVPPARPWLKLSERKAGALRTLHGSPFHINRIGRTVYSGVRCKWETIHSNSGSGRLGGSLRAMDCSLDVLTLSGNKWS